MGNLLSYVLVVYKSCATTNAYESNLVKINTKRNEYFKVKHTHTHILSLTGTHTSKHLPHTPWQQHGFKI